MPDGSFYFPYGINGGFNNFYQFRVMIAMDAIWKLYCVVESVPNRLLVTYLIPFIPYGNLLTFQWSGM